MPAKKRKNNLKNVLNRKREEILKEAKNDIKGHLQGERKVLIETALDDGDWSVIDVAEDVDMALLESHKDSLNKIDESLRKLEEGTYGVCENCGQEITEKRLSALPFAIYCLDCQEKREEIEKVEREEEREE